MSKELRMKQIVAAQWEGDTGLTYSTLALSEDGKVYRYDAGCNGWFPWSMKLAVCDKPHRK